MLDQCLALLALRLKLKVFGRDILVGVHLNVAFNLNVVNVNYIFISIYKYNEC